MIFNLRYVLSLLGAALPLAASAEAGAPERGSGFTWPSHYDFFLPYGTRDGGPVYAKPGYKGVGLTLSCTEATGLLKTRGYRDIEEVACTGPIYRFRVNGSGGPSLIELDPHTGDILKHPKL